MSTSSQIGGVTPLHLQDPCRMLYRKPGRVTGGEHYGQYHIMTAQMRWAEKRVSTNCLQATVKHKQTEVKSNNDNEKRYDINMLCTDKTDQCNDMI